MARKKLNLTFISDHTARKATFKHRKRGLMKKLSELKILCDVDACAIIYNPFNSNLEVWPSNSEVNNVVHRFEMLSASEQIFRSVNHEEFLNQHIAKVQRQKNNLIEDNKEKLTRELMLACLGPDMGVSDMNDDVRRKLCEFIDSYLRVLFHHRNVTLTNPHFEMGESSSMAMARDMAPTTMAQSGSFSFMNLPIFNSPQLTSEFQSIISSNQRPNQVNSLASNLLNPTIFNYPQLNNELQSIVSSRQEPEHVNSLANNFLNALIFNSPQLISSNHGSGHVNSLANNFLNTPIFNSPYQTNEFQSTISSNEGQEHVNSLASNLLPNTDQEVYIPVMTQDEVYYPIQNQNQQDGFVEEMMKLSEQTKFPWM